MKDNIPTTKCQGVYYPKYHFALIAFLLLVPLHALVAQRNLSLYNLNAAPQSYSLNPGRLPMSNGYLSIPALGNLNASFSNSGFNYSALFPAADSTGQENSINFFDNGFQAFLSEIEAENRLLADINAGWLDFGFRAGRNFFSLSANENISLQLDYPKAFFDMLNEVDLGDTLSAGALYDLSSLGLNILHYRSYALGFTRQISSRFSAGARIKMLDGIGTIFSENSGLQFINDPQNTALEINGGLNIFSSGLSTLINNGSTYLNRRSNTGLAFDIGASFTTEKLDLSASILNIGSITWKNDIAYDGISSSKFKFPTDDIDAFEAEFNRFTDSISLQRDSQAVTSFKTTLPALAYFSANYYVTPQTSVNFLLNPRYYNQDVDLAFSVGVQTRIKKILQLGVNYASFNKNIFNIGASASLNLGPLQIFAATDNLPAILNWQNASNVHLNAGLSLAFNGRSRNEQLALWEPEEKKQTQEDEASETIAAIPKDEQQNPGNKKNRQDEDPSLKVSKPTKSNKTEDTPPASNFAADEFLGEEWMDEANNSKKSNRSKSKKPVKNPEPVDVAAREDQDQGKKSEKNEAKKSKNNKADDPENDPEPVDVAAREDQDQGKKSEKNEAKKSKNNKADDSGKDPEPVDFYTTNEYMGEEWMDETNNSKKQKQSKKDTPVNQKSKEAPSVTTEVAEASKSDKKQEKKSDEGKKSDKDSKKSQTAPSQPAPAVVMRKYFSFRGATKDLTNGEMLKGVRVDAYVQLPDGKQQLAFTRNFFTGDFEVLMERDKTYRIIIHKDTFADHEITITPDQMLDKNELLQDVKLKK